MDYQRKIFYSRRRDLLGGKSVKQLIEGMIHSVVAKQAKTMLDKEYPFRSIIEWARANFDVELKLSDLADAEPKEIEELIKERAKDSVKNDISLSLGEYLEDYEDPGTWDAAGLSKWAMSAFHVNLSIGKIKSLSPEEIEEQLIAAAAEQVDKKDCSPLLEFLRDDFAIRRFAEWARAKFDIQFDMEQLRGQNVEQVRDLVLKQTEAKYRRREIEYPVEFALSMVFSPQGANVYGFEDLANWANRKYNAGFTVEHLQNVKPRDLQGELLSLSESYNDGRLDEELNSQIAGLNRTDLVKWANQRFNASLREEDLTDGDGTRQRLAEVGREFLRAELAHLERYVLLQVYDSTWKDHLYAMDHLKDSIWTRSFAEKDPKTEYKREGFRMFNEMLESIEDRVTDIIFRVHIEAGARARSIWRVSQTSHDQVGQFAAGEGQQEAAQAPAGRGAGQADQARPAEGRPQRPLPVRKRQEVQEVLRSERLTNAICGNVHGRTVSYASHRSYSSYAFPSPCAQKKTSSNMALPDVFRRGEKSLLGPLPYRQSCICT